MLIAEIDRRFEALWDARDRNALMNTIHRLIATLARLDDPENPWRSSNGLMGKTEVIWLSIRGLHQGQQHRVAKTDPMRASGGQFTVPRR
jgi:hypothetical protein